jgi:hypothetical protein
MDLGSSFCPCKTLSNNVGLALQVSIIVGVLLLETFKTTVLYFAGMTTLLVSVFQGRKSSWVMLHSLAVRC